MVRPRTKRMTDTFARAALASGAIVAPEERKRDMRALMSFLGLLIAALLFVWALTSVIEQARSETLRRDRPVACREIPNGAARTIACDNGYWITTMPDGTVIDGMGITDPNATALGSTIRIDPRTGGPVSNGQNVTAPDGTIATPGPGQWWYGHPAPQ